MMRRLHFSIFRRFGHIRAATFLSFSGFLAILRRVHFWNFWPFEPCCGSCIFIILGGFGHFPVAAFLLVLAIFAMLRRACIVLSFGRFGDVRAAAF